MKNIFITLCLLFGGVMFITSCGDDDAFCIDNVTHSATLVDIYDVTVELPTGVTYSGGGLSNHSLQIGDYNMVLDIVTLEVVAHETSGDFTLLHYFRDQAGNSFWSIDEITLSNIGEVGKATGQATLNINNGRGDFECPTGDLLIEYSSDFENEKTTFTIAGKVCGGCE
ncbi:MAG: hypothetical protein HKN68_15500 [Saprospiraceae bacterium]|nr:hypothetical protein [Saprospiraceae bacterium]